MALPTSTLESLSPRAASGAFDPLPGSCTRRRSRSPRSIVVGPFVGIALAVLAGVPVGWVDVALVVGLYTITVLGVTAGYHRLFTHHAFVACRPLKIALAVMGSFALEGSLTSWVANHRVHHRFSDHDGDPHSPYAPSLAARRSEACCTRTSAGCSVPGRRPSAVTSPTCSSTATSSWCRGCSRCSQSRPSRCRSSSDGSRPARWPARSPRSCGAACCASCSCTTSRGAPIRCATCSGSDRSAATTGRATSPRSRCCHSESRGTTCTMRSPPRPSRRRPGSARSHCARDPQVGEDGLGPRRALAAPRAARPQAPFRSLGRQGSPSTEWFDQFGSEPFAP